MERCAWQECKPPRDLSQPMAPHPSIRNTVVCFAVLPSGASSDLGKQTAGATLIRPHIVPPPIILGTRVEYQSCLAMYRSFDWSIWSLGIRTPRSQHREYLPSHLILPRAKRLKVHEWRVRERCVSLRLSGQRDQMDRRSKVDRFAPYPNVSRIRAWISPSHLFCIIPSTP